MSNPSTREVFFDSYWPALEQRGWSPVVLHSWENLPGQMDSDVDYAVDGVEMHELLRFLARFSRKHGWRMIQAIEHEPGAYFCVCMQCGGEFQSILLDVTSGYRRIGHRLIDAATLVNGRWKPAGKSFHVPTAGAELRYILAKGAAKKKPFAEIEQRVVELLDADREGCREALQNACQYTRGWQDEDFTLATISKWYETEPMFLAVRQGRTFGWAEWMLYLRRILRPTGVCVCVTGETRHEILAELAERLRPGFRRVHCVASFGVLQWLEMAMRLIKTTVVVAGKKQPGSGFKWFGNRIFVCYSENDGAIREVLDLLSLRLDARLGGAPDGMASS